MIKTLYKAAVYSRPKTCSRLRPRVRSLKNLRSWYFKHKQPIANRNCFTKGVFGNLLFLMLKNWNNLQLSTLASYHFSGGTGTSPFTSSGGPKPCGEGGRGGGPTASEVTWHKPHRRRDARAGSYRNTHVPVPTYIPTYGNLPYLTVNTFQGTVALDLTEIHMYRYLPTDIPGGGVQSDQSNYLFITQV